MVKLRRILESELYLESKKDLEDLKEYLGQDLFDAYMKIRDRIPKDKNDYKDFQKLKKKDKKDIMDFINSFQSKSDKKKQDKSEGAEKLYDGKDWVVYKITSYPAAQLYGKNTRWCITGRYPGHEGRGEEYFNDYIDKRRLDGGYYFFIDKLDPNRKFCALRYQSGGIDSIWNAEDSVLSDVDRDEAPYDLEYIADDLPNGLGEDIMEYIENSAGEDFDVFEALATELSKPQSMWNLDRIKMYADYVEEADVEDFDEYYDCLLENNLIKDNKIEAFKILLNSVLPTEDWFQTNYQYRANMLGKECLEVLIDKVVQNKDDLDEDYFNQFFTYLWVLYSDFKNPQHILTIFDNCSSDYLDDSDIDFESFMRDLGEKVYLDKNFLPICFRHGFNTTSFMDALDDFSYHNEKLRIPLLRSAIEEGLVNLNDKTEGSNSSTVFQYALTWNPSVDEVKWMISKGANPDIKDSKGSTAIDYTDDPKIEELLK